MDAVIGGALVPSVSLERIVSQREAIAARLTAAHEGLRAAAELCEAMQLDVGCALELRTYSGSRSFNDPDGLTHTLRVLDGKIWSYLLEQSGLRSFLDATAREQWRKALETDEVPEVTQANIEATFAALYSSRGDMFERGIVELFRNLSWDYKTNSPVKLGRKLVLRHVVDGLGGRWDWATPSFTGCDRLDDLIRVMSILDNKPEPDHRLGAYHCLKAAGFPQAGQVDLNYFTLRGYKNGNGHLSFVRADLVDAMNKIIARHYPNALPPADG